MPILYFHFFTLFLHVIINSWFTCISITRANTCPPPTRQNGECLWKTSVPYLEVAHQQPASVRILLVPIWMCEKICQFNCGRLVESQTIVNFLSTNKNWPPLYNWKNSQYGEKLQTNKELFQWTCYSEHLHYRHIP
jgi:hypothetical protein